MIHFGFDFTVNASEVAPGQHEMSPVFRAANVSCDSNVPLMQRKSSSKPSSFNCVPCEKASGACICPNDIYIYTYFWFDETSTYNNDILLCHLAFFLGNSEFSLQSWGVLHGDHEPWGSQTGFAGALPWDTGQLKLAKELGSVLFPAMSCSKLYAREPLPTEK